MLYHFRSKESLIQAMVASLVERFDADIETARRQEPADEREAPGGWLRAYIRSSAGPAEDDEDTVALLAAVATDPRLLVRLQEQKARWQEQAEADSADPTLATVIRLALDGRGWPTLRTGPASRARYEIRYSPRWSGWRARRTRCGHRVRVDRKVRRCDGVVLFDPGDPAGDRGYDDVEALGWFHEVAAGRGDGRLLRAELRLLSLTLKRIDVGVAYAWSALGTALIATIGPPWFHQPVTGAESVRACRYHRRRRGPLFLRRRPLGMELTPWSIHALPSCSKYCFIIASVRRFSLRMGRIIIGRRGASTPDSRGVVVR